MFDRVRQLISPPFFEGDEEKTRIASLLNSTLWATLTVAVLALFFLSWFARLEGTALVTGGSILLVSGTWAILHRGHVRAACMFFVFLLFLIETYLMVASGGADTSLVVSYVVVMIVAAVLLGGRAVFLFAGLSIAAILGMVYLEFNGVLPTATSITSPIGRLAWLIAHALLGATLLYLAVRGINRALDRARTTERDLIESNRQLQGVQASLQERNEVLQTTVRQYGDHLTQVAQGDLTVRLSLNGDGDGNDDDPLIVLGHRMNETVAALQGMIAMIRDTVDELGEVSAEILNSTARQVASASEQSAVIDQTANTVDEVRDIAEQVVARAEEVADGARRSLDFSRAGTSSVQSNVESMVQIQTRVESIAENIMSLSGHTQRIGQIIATVNEIASQSNMLALNASVEAARAGENGKGFSVVAEEVRSLSEQSKRATIQVKMILSDILRATELTGLATEEGVARVEKGVESATRMGEAIQQLGNVIAGSSQAATQTVAGGRQQSAGIDRIALAMGNIKQATTQSMTSIRQAGGAARNLNKLARNLAKSVEQYRL